MVTHLIKLNLLWPNSLLKPIRKQLIRLNLKVHLRCYHFVWLVKERYLFSWLSATLGRVRISLTEWWYKLFLPLFIEQANSATTEKTKRTHNQPQDKEPDTPPVDELLPEKLARVSSHSSLHFLLLLSTFHPAVRFEWFCGTTSCQCYHSNATDSYFTVYLTLSPLVLLLFTWISFGPRRHWSFLIWWSSFIPPSSFVCSLFLCNVRNSLITKLKVMRNKNQRSF